MRGLGWWLIGMALGFLAGLSAWTLLHKTSALGLCVCIEEAGKDRPRSTGLPLMHL